MNDDAEKRRVLAEFHYYILRFRAREAVVNDILRRLREEGGEDKWHNIKLASLGIEAVRYAAENWHRVDRLMDRFHAPDREHHFFSTIARPSHFGVAVWQSGTEADVLHGIAMGRPSNNKTSLTINWIERSYDPSFPKGGILLPVMACAEEYAKLLGCRTIYVKNPVDGNALADYGYRHIRRLDATGVYYFKDVTPC
jgi:hypothetical protein